MCFSTLLALLGLLGLGIEQPDDAVGIAHRRYFRVGDDDGGVGEAHGERGPALDAGRAVADHPIEFATQLLDDAGNACLGQRILVARLRGRQQPQGLDALVADERLRKLRHALHHVDQVEHNSALGSHHQIEVAQADVEIDHGDVLAGLRERGAKRGGRVVLPTPPLPDVTTSTLATFAISCPFQSAIVSTRSSSQHCTGGWHRLLRSNGVRACHGGPRRDVNSYQSVNPIRARVVNEGLTRNSSN